jgi:hypothetical protein
VNPRAQLNAYQHNRKPDYTTGRSQFTAIKVHPQIASKLIPRPPVTQTAAITYSTAVKHSVLCSMGQSSVQAAPVVAAVPCCCQAAAAHVKVYVLCPSACKILAAHRHSLCATGPVQLVSRSSCSTHSSTMWWVLSTCDLAAKCDHCGHHPSHVNQTVLGQACLNPKCGGVAWGAPYISWLPASCSTHEKNMEGVARQASIPSVKDTHRDESITITRICSEGLLLVYKLLHCLYCHRVY